MQIATSVGEKPWSEIATDALRRVMAVIEATYGRDENGEIDRDEPGTASGADIVESLCGCEEPVRLALERSPHLVSAVAQDSPKGTDGPLPQRRGWGIPELGFGAKTPSGPDAGLRCEHLVTGLTCAGTATAVVAGRRLCQMHAELARQESPAGDG